MANLLGAKGNRCEAVRNALEEMDTNPASDHLTAAMVIGELGNEDRAHIGTCAKCEEAVGEYVESRRLMSVLTTGKQPSAFFANRVMAAIQAREFELSDLLSPWALIPRFASRLAWVSVLGLAVAASWMYISPANHGAVRPAVDAATYGLFETSAPPVDSKDAVLVSLAENPNE